MKVNKNEDFIAPGLVVEKHSKDGFKSAHALPKRSYFNGHVNSDPGSLVAISSDDSGLVCTIVPPKNKFKKNLQRIYNVYLFISFIH